MRLIWILAILLLYGLPVLSAQQTRRTDPIQAPAQQTDIYARPTPIRQQRPVALVGSLLGKTPLFGALVDINLHPHGALGIGYGHFSIDSISGSFIPLYIQGYVLKSNFSPYIQAGANFITVTIESKNTLLNSTFRGTQLMVGGGLEYRFDFGFVARTELLYYLNAKIWSPGLAIGYSMLVL